MNDYQALRRAAIRELTIGCGGREVASTVVPLEPAFRRFSWHRYNGSSATSVAIPSSARWTVLRVRPSAEDDQLTRDGPAQILASLPVEGPVSFEVIGSLPKTGGGDPSVAIQVAVAGDGERVAAALSAHYPSAEIFEEEDLLPAAAESAQDLYVTTFRLAEPYLFSLRHDQPTDPLGTLLGLLDGLRPGEVGGLQVLFAPVAHDWGGNIRRVAEDPFNPGKSAFKDLPELLKKAEKKAGWPLFAVSVRVMASSRTLAERLTDFLGQYSAENRLISLPQSLPASSAAARTNHVSGMLLNAQELGALVHLPSPQLVEATGLETAAVGGPPPDAAAADMVVHLGENSYRGKITPVGIPARLLPRHCAIFGATGSGKTNLLLRFAELVHRGYGLAFLDPNGDAAEEFLRLIPQHRVQDTIYFNPADRDYPPALNVLEASDEREREMLASDLLVALKHLFDRWWGYRQEVLLRQCIMTLLFSEGTKNLRDIPRLLLNEAYRESVLETVADQDIHAFWQMQFPTLRKDALGPVLSKVSKFVDNRLVRAIVAQPNLIDFHRVMNEGKVFVANLAKGLIQEDTSTLLGSMILAKLQVATMARAALPPQERRPFVIVADEFQNYAGEGADTSSIRSFLSEARKYNVGLVAATQFISQLARDVQTAIFGNVGTLVALRCGVLDASLLQKELGRFSMEDILDLGVGEAIVRMERSLDSFNLAIDEVHVPQHSHRDEIVALSRERYCRPRAEVQAMLQQPESQRAAAPTQGEGAKPAAPSREARMFLVHLIDHPDRSVTQLYADLSLSGYKGDQAKRMLVDGGFVQEVAAPLGRRGRAAKFLVPTAVAYGLLGRERPRGKGGPLHRLLQRVVADRARRNGYEATVEAPIPGGQVDVALRGRDGAVAVEVEVSDNPEQRLANIRKCLDNGFSRVIIIFVDRQDRDTSQLHMAKALTDADKGRVALCLLDNLDDQL